MDNIDFNNVNDKFSNYSKVNGTMIRKIKNKNLTIRKLELEKCPICDNKIGDSDIYCKFCGFNLEGAYNTNKQKTKLKKWDYKDIISYLNIPKTFITSVVAIVILFIVSIILKGVLSNYIPDVVDIINPIHILLGLNLGSLNIYSSTSMGWSGFDINLGIIALVLIPIISITISNLIFNKKNTKDSQSALRNSLGVGITYGLILGVLALFSKTQFSYSYDMMQYGYIVRFSFEALGMILKGFILGFLSTYVLLYKKEYEDENMYLGILKRAINMLFIGYILTFVILCILTIADKSYLYDLGISNYVNQVGIGLGLSQLSAYIWSFGNFVPVNIGSQDLSIFNLIGSDKYLSTTLMLIAMFFLSALVIIVSACKLEVKYGKKEEGIKPILLLSGFYAILVGLLSIVTTVTLGNSVDIFTLSNYTSAFTMGFGMISSMLIAFIYSFLISLVGYKLNIFN